MGNLDDEIVRVSDALAKELCLDAWTVGFTAPEKCKKIRPRAHFRARRREEETT